MHDFQMNAMRLRVTLSLKHQRVIQESITKAIFCLYTAQLIAQKLNLSILSCIRCNPLLQCAHMIPIMLAGTSSIVFSCH